MNDIPALNRDLDKLLYLLNVARLLPLLPLRDDELNTVTLRQRAVTGSGDRRIMNEYVCLDAIDFDKAVALGVIEPLDNTGRQIG